MSARHHGSLRQAWLVLVLALLFGGALAGVHVGLGERIEANKRAEALSQLPALLLPAAAVEGAVVTVEGERITVVPGQGEPRVLTVEELWIGEHPVFAVREAASGRRLGWVVRGSGQGYAGVIELLVGLDPDARRVTGLYVLSQTETPALGDRITGAEFRRRFAGAPAAVPLAAVRAAAEGDPSRVLALTGATVSSQSVCDIVNRTLAAVRGPLAAEGAGVETAP